MTVPYRSTTGDGTYFVTASIFQKKALLQSDRMAALFIETLIDYRAQEKYKLHEFVVMPNHFHLLLTPIVTLERAVQFIKWGFSFRARRLFHLRCSIWQTSFYDRRVRDLSEYDTFREYIYQNPVKRRLSVNPAEYPYSSASGKLSLDPPPQRLKPLARQYQKCSAEALLHP
jgi:putative transposase